MPDKFILHSNYKPTGDQPQAIEKLTEGIEKGYTDQVLLGVTGSGKTFTMANIISKVNLPTFAPKSMIKCRFQWLFNTK